MEYNDTLHFSENREEGPEGYILAIPDHWYLRHQREGLGMTQQEVSNAAGIHIRQYQRLESGEKSMSSASLRIALSICDVLQLDPHRFIVPPPGKKA